MVYDALLVGVIGMIKVTSNRGSVDLQISGTGDRLISELLMINREVLRGMIEDSPAEVGKMLVETFMQAISVPQIWLADDPAEVVLKRGGGDPMKHG